MGNPTSFRLPDVTVQLVLELAEKMGISRTDVVMLAIDRMAIDEIERAERRNRERKTKNLNAKERP